VQSHRGLPRARGAADPRRPAPLPADQGRLLRVQPDHPVLNRAGERGAQSGHFGLVQREERALDVLGLVPGRDVDRRHGIGEQPPDQRDLLGTEHDGTPEDHVGQGLQIAEQHPPQGRLVVRRCVGEADQGDGSQQRCVRRGQQPVDVYGEPLQAAEALPGTLGRRDPLRHDAWRARFPSCLGPHPTQGMNERRTPGGRQRHQRSFGGRRWGLDRRQRKRPGAQPFGLPSAGGEASDRPGRAGAGRRPG